MKSLVEFITEAAKYSEDWIWEIWSEYAEAYYEDKFKGSELTQEFEDLAKNPENNKHFNTILNNIQTEEHISKRKMEGTMDTWIKTAKAWAHEMML